MARSFADRLLRPFERPKRLVERSRSTVVAVWSDGELDRRDRSRHAACRNEAETRCENCRAHSQNLPLDVKAVP